MHVTISVHPDKLVGEFSSHGLGSLKWPGRILSISKCIQRIKTTKIMTNTEAEKLQSCPWGSSVFALGRKGSGGRERTGRRHLLTKDESESSDGSCSLTALRMASQGSVWEAQRDEDSSSLSGDAMEAQALGCFSACHHPSSPARDTG